MRHRKKQFKLGRPSAHRRAMLANLVTSLFKHERVQTTHVKAQAARSLAERLISYAREGSLASRRLAAGYIREPKVLKKLFDEIAPKFKDRPSGTVRMTKLWPRHGDGALMALMELHGSKFKAKAAKGEKAGRPAKSEKRPTEKKEAFAKRKAESKDRGEEGAKKTEEKK